MKLWSIFSRDERWSDCIEKKVIGQRRSLSSSFGQSDCEGMESDDDDEGRVWGSSGGPDQIGPEKMHKKDLQNPQD